MNSIEKKKPNRIYKLLVKMHKIDFYFLHFNPELYYDTQFRFVPKDEYTIKDFLSYSVSCFLYYSIKTIAWIIGKVARINKVIARKEE